MVSEHPEAALPEAAFFDDAAFGADLKAKVAEAWREFAQHLALVLPQLPAETTIDITLDPTASGIGDAVYGVQVSLDGAMVVATAVGNADLPPAYRLDRSSIAGLVALGWSPPGVVPGSGEAFGARLPLADAATIAVLVSRTMRDVYGAPHPAFLTYAAHGADSQATVPVVALGAARSLALAEESSEIAGDVTASHLTLADLADSGLDLPLAERVAIVVARLLNTTPDALPCDPDGDIGIRAGSAMVFVRVRDNPPLIDVFSPVLTEITPTHKLYAKLSELTHRMPIGRLYCTDDTVWASVPVFGRNFQASHLMLAVQVMTGLADELDDRLHGEFGGKRFFGEGDKAVPTNGEISEGDAARTGMYL
jgi:hypothetical protein